MRSYWKGPFIDSFLLRYKRKIMKAKQNKNKGEGSVFAIRSRRSTILPFCENINLKIYNGQHYVWVSPKLHHVGYKIGDFVLVKKKCNVKIKKKIVSKKK